MVDDYDDTPTRRLDRLSGRIAEFKELTPDDYRHLAQTLDSMADRVEAVQSAGYKRDQKLNGVASDVTEIKSDVGGLKVQVSDLSRQFTEKDIEVMAKLVANFNFNERAWKGVYRYIGIAFGIATTVWVLHEPISRIIAWAGRAVSP